MSCAGLFSVDDWEGWQRACVASWPQVMPEIMERFDGDDREQYQRFFWPDWIRRRRDVPERIGYFIGYQVVRALARRYPLSEIVRWSDERAGVEVRGLLEASPTAPS